MSIKVKENQFQFKGSFPLTVVQEDGIFIASCPILDDLSSYGDTIEEAQNNFSQALIGTLMILKEENKLEDFLTSCGWKLEEKDEQMFIIPPFVVKTLDYNPNLQIQQNNHLVNA